MKTYVVKQPEGLPILISEAEQESPGFVLVHGHGAPGNIDMMLNFLEKGFGFLPTHTVANIDQYSPNATFVNPFSKQAEAVFTAIKALHGAIEGAGTASTPIVVLSHSMGAIPAMDGAVKFYRHLKFATNMGGSKIITVCMAPPGVNAGKDFIARREADGKLFYHNGKIRKGINPTGYTQQNRTTQPTTFMPREWFTELENARPDVKARSVVSSGKLALICASDDPVLPKSWEGYMSGDLHEQIDLHIVPSSSHDFVGAEGEVGQAIRQVLLG